MEQSARNRDHVSISIIRFFFQTYKSNYSSLLFDVVLTILAPSQPLVSRLQLDTGESSDGGEQSDYGELLFHCLVVSYDNI